MVAVGDYSQDCDRKERKQAFDGLQLLISIGGMRLLKDVIGRDAEF